MKIYSDLTHGLQATLLHATRGYTLTTKSPILVDINKMPGIVAKFIDQYGTNLPSWKRYQRKVKGLPNSVGVVIPVLGNPYQRQVILLCTPFDTLHLKSLSEKNPFLGEEWRTQIRVGDFEIVSDKRDRGDQAMTWKLTKHAFLVFESHLQNRSRNNDWQKLIQELNHAVRIYPMFGGIRRQLRRLITSYKKLYEHKFLKEWSGPDPENLPMMVGFRRDKSDSNKKQQEDPVVSVARQSFA